MSGHVTRAWVRFVFAFVVAGLFGTEVVGQEAGAKAPRLETFTDAKGVGYFALSIADRSDGTEARAIDLALVLDLSASQAGEAFQTTIGLTREILAGLVGGSRVQIALANRADLKVNAGPAAVGSDALTKAMREIEAASPIGITDLPATFDRVEAWLEDRSGDLPKRVLILGDGQSTGTALSAERLGAAVDKLARAQSPLSFVALGDGASPAALPSAAVRTGGRVWSANGKAAGLSTAILESIHRPTFFASDIDLEPKPTLVLPKSPPPLRGDQETLIVGQWAPAESMKVRIRGNRDGRPAELDLTAKAKAAGVEGQYVADLVQHWQAKPDLPAMHDAATTLARARAMTATRTEAIAAQAQAALAARRLDDAELFYETVLAWRPGDLEAATGVRAVQRLRKGVDPRPAVRVPVTETIPPTVAVARPPATEGAAASDGKEPLRKEPSGDLISDAKARASVEKQKLTADVTRSLEEARRSAKSDIDLAIRTLKRTIEALDASTLEDDAKARLRQRIESELRILHRERTRTEVEKLERTTALARAESRTMLIGAELTRQQQQLLDRYNALMAERLYGQAVAVAEQALADHPDSVEASAAVLESQLAHRYDKNEWVEVAKGKGWWDTLYPPEVSAIPVPDSAVIVFPPAKEWEELTKRREKYKVVDLSPVSPAEDKIRKTLSKPVSFQFRESPLSDVINFLRDFTGINIVLDAKGLDEAGVDLDTPITLELENVSLRSALHLLLGPLELSYLVRDDVLLITSQQEADGYLITKVYPVADLVMPIQNFNQGGFGTNGFNVGNNPQSGGQGLQGGGGFGGGAGQGGFGRGGPAAGAGGGGPIQGDASQALIELIQNVIGDQSNAGPPQKGGDAFLASNERWEGYFAKHRETEASLRGAVRRLVAANRHDQVISLLQASFRHQPATPWMLKALALSAQLHGMDEGAIRAAILSPIDIQPNDVALRLTAAEALASAGQSPAAIGLLRAWANGSPGSVNTYYLALKIAGEAGDAETAAWAADQIFARDWPGENDRVHERTADLLNRVAATFRSEGRPKDADRLAEVAAASRDRDLVITIRWEGAADIDLTVVEPGSFLCSTLSPRTVGGGVLVSSDTGNREQYIAAQAFSGTYEVRLNPVWGQPTGGIVNVDVVQHQGMASERRERHTVKLGDSREPILVRLEGGRRKELSPIDSDSHLVFDVPAPQRSNPRLQLRQMLQSGQIARDPNAPVMAQAPGGVGAVGFGRSIPFAGAVGTVGGGAVAFDPVVEVLQDGLTLQAQAVVSADRRFVRMTLVPLLQNIQSINDVRTIQVGGTAGGGGFQINP